jgi:hypothetical protein
VRDEGAAGDRRQKKTQEDVRRETHENFKTQRGIIQNSDIQGHYVLFLILHY